MKIRTKGIVSSDIPKIVPPREKRTMVTGMKYFLRFGFRANAYATRCTPTAIAPVFWTTENAPPMMNTNAMICAACTNPLTGAVRIAPIP